MKNVLLWMIGTASVVGLGLGWLWSHPLLAGSGLIGLAYVLSSVGTRIAPRRTKTGGRRPAQPVAAAGYGIPASPATNVVKPPRERPSANDTDALVEQMLSQGRYALLLRPQITANLHQQHLRRAREALQEGMALVPDGEVVLGQIGESLDNAKPEEEEIAEHQGRVVWVEQFFLDRYPVTNRQFYEFVVGGGYEQISLWDESIWPAVLDFVDQTGEPGPRYWSGGCYQPGREDHPVVGVSWYEAAAYARWLGKRLPTDAEWVKAGSWPVSLSATTRVQRKYPWGDTMERSRANLWESGPKDTVPVDQFSEGVSVGGVYQLIGNVWEWTRGNFHGVTYPDGYLVLERQMKNIRGGAFDTYFDHQASCQFQSGEVAIARKHNIGFRCAVGVCDLTLSHTLEDSSSQPEEIADPPPRGGGAWHPRIPPTAGRAEVEPTAVEEVQS